MNGILLVNKDYGLTSRDVINKLNRIFSTKEIGHTGTLDPIATGVLVICLGKCTKLVELLTSTEKEYIATIKLGITTDTLDITGNITKTSTFSLTKEQIINTLNSFLGTYHQEVPIYSAIKVKGKKLYEYARNNEEVTLPKKEVTIQSIELISFHEDTIKFKCTVSKGTYIRSLIRDICQKLGVCGTMSALTRTRQGTFNLENAQTITDIEQGNYQLLSPKDVLKDYETIAITKEEYHNIKNGNIIPKTFQNDKAVFTYQNEIIAIYQTYHKDNTKAKPYKMFT